MKSGWGREANTKADESRYYGLCGGGCGSSGDVFGSKFLSKLLS